MANDARVTSVAVEIIRSTSGAPIGGGGGGVKPVLIIMSG